MGVPLEAGIPSRPVTIFQVQRRATAITMAGLAITRAEHDIIVQLRVSRIRRLYGIEDTILVHPLIGRQR